jgi:hypothetical protein
MLLAESAKSRGSGGGGPPPPGTGGTERFRSVSVKGPISATGDESNPFAYGLAPARKPSASSEDSACRCHPDTDRRNPPQELGGEASILPDVSGFHLTPKEGVCKIGEELNSEPYIVLKTGVNSPLLRRLVMPRQPRFLTGPGDAPQRHGDPRDDMILADEPALYPSSLCPLCLCGELSCETKPICGQFQM